MILQFIVVASDVSSTDKAYLSDSMHCRVTNISQSSTYKMAAKTSWHRYETKLRHCHLMYTRCTELAKYFFCNFISIDDVLSSNIYDKYDRAAKDGKSVR